MYEDIYQSIHSRSNSSLIDKKNTQDQDHEIIDLSIDDDDDDDDDDIHLSNRLLCLCQKTWDRTKWMLQCNSCANWYHGDCVGITKEQARLLETNSDQFICPPCRGLSRPIVQSTKSYESMAVKRKYSDRFSSTDNPKTKENRIFSKSISHDRSIKRLKTEPLPKNQKPCIVHDCNNPAKSDWIYCSSACIRRHINHTLQIIQRSKGINNEDVPTRDDILLYESKSKQVLEKHLVPKIEDLCTWLNQHPTYEIKKSSSNQSKDLIRSSSTNTKTIKLLSISSITKPEKSIPNRKKFISTTKETKKRQSTSSDSTIDIRSKVPTALYDKIIMRLEKHGETSLINDDIRLIVHQIEEEMFNIYGKVDNSYKNKFRSLLANISNMTNNFFYKQILSKELTAKQIVAMKAEDMLPPEEKEKRKDQFEKEVQMIIKAEQQKADELARRARSNVPQQVLLDNDSFVQPFITKEPSASKEKLVKINDKPSANSSPKHKDKKPLTSITIHEEKLQPSNPIVSSVLPISTVVTLPSTPVSKIVDSNKPVKLTSSFDIFNPIHSVSTENDSDNDYIEPESPTGVDALIYDEDDDNNNNDDGSDIINNSSQSSSTPSTIEKAKINSPSQEVHLENCNPPFVRSQLTPNRQPSYQWRGIIHSTDLQIPCRSVHIYGDSDHLISNIPEKLTILGRLRLGDLWDYIQESLAVRDVLILTLTSSSSSSLNSHDNEIFLQYVDSMQTSRRAAVISKCSNTSYIRDMYILAANTKDCPASVISSLFLPAIFETKQLFLVIIGSGRKTIKSVTRSNENLSFNHFTYKPMALQDTSTTRDPRLAKNKDPRLNRSNTIQNNPISPSQTTNTKPKSVQATNDDLLKLISESLQFIHRSSTVDSIHSIVTSTVETLKINKRDDLCTSFLHDYQIIFTEWSKRHANTSMTVAGDNLIEENMDVVDDDQDEKHKKQLTISSTLPDDFNDIDYRFLDPDMDHSMTSSVTSNDHHHRKQRRKSRFSDILPTDFNRCVKLKSKDERQNSTIPNKDLSTDTTKISSTKSIDVSF
ncbi:hypothetical protein I4U23_018326 [Adineta vaga]|nr:hypothetical protein I4U23_018326 [Adineta vaga]